MSKLFTFLSIFFWILFHALFGAYSSFSQVRAPQTDPQEQRLLELSETFSQRFAERRAEAEAFALANDLPVRLEMEDGTIIELQFIDELGVPQYYITNNLNAARTTFTNRLWTGGLSGLDLMGNSYLLGIWDGGGVRTTHVEFNQGGLGARVIQQDTPADLSNHATHVAGTMVAGGVSSTARGMAPEATLHAYDWNDDLAEMAAAAAAGLTVSNHSYGFRRGWWRNQETNQWWWFGNTSISTTEDYLFGFYDDVSRDWDQLAFDAPHYLIVKSAGNERNDNHTGGHWVQNTSGTWVWSTLARDPDGGADGFDCMSHQAVSKNVLTVGAVHDIPGGWTQPSDVQITTFSSWGPTDDGRIKPDIVANGQTLTSSGSSFNTHYDQMSGTSMSAPNVSGTLGLLQEHYRNGRGGAMSAAALKGLVINTANEAGTSEGPDYTFGWGLLNATGAADLISDDATEGGLIVQGLLIQGQTKDYTYYSDGSPISVTLAWTDPPGTPPAASLNPTNLMLVNDLDLRVIRQSPGTTYQPWRLNPSNPAAAATKGNNFRDNVERVNVNNPTPGYYTIRVSHSGSLQGLQQAYALIIDGLSTPPSQTYCEARSTNFNSFERITKVQFGGIDNPSQRSPGGYSNYTGLVGNISKGSSETITVTFAGGDAQTQGKVWIDWNQNGIFENDEMYDLGTGAGPVYSTTITAPTSALSGYTTMRVRVVYGSTLTPCNTTTWGETEDYAIRVTGTPGRWNGIVSSDWHNPLNWDDVSIPTLSTNVNIPATAPNQPEINSYAICRNLFLQTGATLTHNNSFLDVYGTFDAGFGQYTMTSDAASLYFMGSGNAFWWDDNQDDTYTNVYIWKDDNDATVTMRHSVTCSGLFRIIQGRFTLLTNRILNVESTSFEALRVSANGTLVLENNREINVNGGIRFRNNSNAEISGGILRCGGNFSVDENNDNNIDLTGSTLVMNGAGVQYIRDLDNGNLILGNLHVDKSSGKVYIGDADLNISGDLHIIEGTLSSFDSPTETNSYNINIAGNWTNDAFPDGFEPGNGRVVFNGSEHQYIYSDENFNILQANMGEAIRIPYAGQTVSCNLYDWTMGGIDVFEDATFNAYDLQQQGLFGGYWLNPGSEINLYQTDNQWVDVDGLLNFNGGGTLNVYGGLGNSFWAFSQDANIIMNGGVLDFKTAGITISNTSNNLNFNVTNNAVIRTAGGTSVTRPGFNPTSGTFEFYGTTGRTFNQSNGATLHNVIINKGIESRGNDHLNLFDERSGMALSDGTRSGNINLISNFVVTNNLFIESGSLTLNGRELTINGSCHVDGTLNMTNDLDVLNVGTESWSWLEFRNGSTANLQMGNIYCYGWVVPRPGSSFNPGLGLTKHFIGNNGGGIANLEPTATYSNVIINKNPGNTAYFASDATEAVTVTGDFTVLPNNRFVIQGNNLTINGVLNDDPTSEIYAMFLPLRSDEGSISGEEAGNRSYGSRSVNLQIDTDFTLLGLLNVDNGSVLVNGRFASASTSEIVIEGGSFISAAPNHPDKGWQYIEGNLTMSGGLFEFTHNSVHFGSTATTSVSGGIIRTAGAFLANSPGVFQPTGGAVEIIGDYVDKAIYCYNGNHFHDLIINRTSGHSNFMFGEPVTIQNNLYVENGEILTGLSVVSVYGNAVVNSGGKLTVSPAGSLAMAANRSITVNDGGAIELNGNATNQSKITRISTGHYALNIESSATIGATHGIFEYLNSNGVNIKPGAMVDPDKAFSNSIFRLGQSGGRLMTINNAQTFTVNNAFFPANTWGGNFNVYKNVDSGEVYFVDATGDFAGAAFEFDPHSRIFWGDEPLTHNISLPAGWSGLSSYLMPLNTNIVDIFAPVNTSFIVAQTMSSVYFPDGGINTIGNWASQSAYKVKMSDPATLSIVGYEEAGDVFNLSSGWNLVPVITNVPVNVASLFAASDLVLAKDVAGFGVYWPAMGINTLGDLLPGSAYFALMNTAGSITFPSSSKDGWTGELPAYKLPEHPWNEINISPSSHLIAIEAEGMMNVMQGDIIGVFSQDGQSWGVTEFISTNDNLFLTAYADDPYTSFKDGFAEMELMSYKLYRPQTGEIFDLEVEYNLQMPHTGHFAGEGLSAIKMLKIGATGTTSALAEGISIYPNPTDGMVWIAGISDFERIELISAVGQSLITISNDSENTISLDISGLQSGIYQVRLTGENGTVVKRIVKR